MCLLKEIQNMVRIEQEMPPPYVYGYKRTNQAVRKRGRERNKRQCMLHEVCV